jgi:hypothetical protein
MFMWGLATTSRLHPRTSPTGKWQTSQAKMMDGGRAALDFFSDSKIRAKL